MSTNLSVGIMGAGPGVAVRPAALAEFIAKIDRWMIGTVWTTQCSNYFRAADGRVVTQWPRSARSFWEVTCRFKPADFSFSSFPADAVSGVDGSGLQATTALYRSGR